jgi:hypothetical protein
MILPFAQRDEKVETADEIRTANWHSHKKDEIDPWMTRISAVSLQS